MAKSGADMYLSGRLQPENMLSTGNEVRRTANREPPAIVAVIGTVGHVNNLRALLITLIM